VSVAADQPWIRVVEDERVIRLTLDVATAVSMMVPSP
jgi:hypothetical protein